MVESLQHAVFDRSYSQIIFKHKPCKFFPVDQHNTFTSYINIFDSLFRETWGCYQDALASTETIQTTSKRLNDRSSNVGFLSFCLDSDRIQPQAVFFDSPINHYIAGAPQRLASIFLRTAVAHIRTSTLITSDSKNSGVDFLTLSRTSSRRAFVSSR